MAEDRIALLKMLRKATADGDRDFLREFVRVPPQAASTVSYVTLLMPWSRSSWPPL